MTSGAPDHETVLVRASGRDQPGITAGLMAILDRCGAEVHDVE
jgi:predicted amino acid-binding ACT domain protein